MVFEKIRDESGKGLDDRNIFDVLANWRYIDEINESDVSINELVLGLEIILEGLLAFDPMVKAYKAIGEKASPYRSDVNFLDKDPSRYIETLNIDKEVVSFLDNDIAKYSLVTPAVKLLNDNIFGIKETDIFIKRYQNIFLKNIRDIGISISRSFKGGNILVENIDKEVLSEIIDKTECDIKELYLEMMTKKVERLQKSYKRSNDSEYIIKSKGELLVIENEIKEVLKNNISNNIFIAVGIDSSSFRKRHLGGENDKIKHNQILAEAMARAEWAVNQAKYRTDTSNHFDRSKVYEFNLSQSYNDIILTYKKVLDTVKINGVLSPIYESIFTLKNNAVEIRENALKALRKKESLFSKEYFSKIKKIINVEVNSEIDVLLDRKLKGESIDDIKFNHLNEYFTNIEYINSLSLSELNKLKKFKDIKEIKSNIYNRTIQLMERYYKMINIPDILKNYINEDFDKYIKRKDLLVSYILYGEKLIEFAKRCNTSDVEKNQKLKQKIAKLYSAVFEESKLLMKNRDYTNKISGTLVAVILRYKTNNEIILVIGDHIGFGPRNMKNNEKFINEMFNGIGGSKIIEAMAKKSDNQSEYRILVKEVKNQLNEKIESEFNEKIKTAGDISSMELREKEKLLKTGLEDVFKKNGVDINVSLDATGGDEINFVFDFRKKDEDVVIKNINKFLKETSKKEEIRFAYTISKGDSRFKYKLNDNIYDKNGWIENIDNSITKVALISEETRKEIAEFNLKIKKSEEHLSKIKEYENNGKIGVVIRFDTDGGKVV